LPKAKKVTAKIGRSFEKAIDNLTREKLDIDELSDRYATKITELVESKEKKGEDLVKTSGADTEDGEPPSADVLDLMKVLRQRVSPKATVTTADEAAASASNVYELATSRTRGRSTPTRARKRRRG
jgi:non-homologous end joining protein Ku